MLGNGYVEMYGKCKMSKSYIYICRSASGRECRLGLIITSVKLWLVNIYGQPKGVASPQSYWFGRVSGHQNWYYKYMPSVVIYYRRTFCVRNSSVWYVVVVWRQCDRSGAGENVYSTSSVPPRGRRIVIVGVIAETSGLEQPSARTRTSVPVSENIMWYVWCTCVRDYLVIYIYI